MTDLPTSRIDLKAVLHSSAPTVAKDDHSEGMSYLQSVPRRLVTLYLPLSIIVVVLLFPFYWMGLTAIKPDEQLLDLDKFNPFWTWNPTFKHIHKLLFDSYYPGAVNTMYVAVCAPSCRSSPAFWRPTRLCASRSGANGSRADLPVLYLCHPRSCSSRLATVVSSTACSTRRWRYPDLSSILIPFSDLALMGLCKTIPYDGRMRADRCASRCRSWHDVLPLATRADSGVIFCFTLCWKSSLCADVPSIASNNRCRSRSSQFVDGESIAGS